MDAAQITGVILCGGRASRMGGQDKGLILLANTPLWQHVYQRLAPQVGQVVISANRNLSQYQRSGLPVITDNLPDYPGPLAGVLTALDYGDNSWYFFCACDTPGIPEDMVMKLWQSKGDSPVAWVHDGDRDHPTIALVHRSVRAALADYLQQGERRVMAFFRQQQGVAVKLAGYSPKAFSNINSPEDIAQWQERSL